MNDEIVKKISIFKTCKSKKDSNKNNEGSNLIEKNHGGWNCKKKSKNRSQTKKIAIKIMGTESER